MIMNARRIMTGFGAVLIATHTAAVAQSDLYGPRDIADPVPVALARPGGINPDLAATAARALDTYPALGAGRASVRAADKDIDSARWLRFPSVSVEALVFSGGNAITGRDNATANLVVDQPIWAGGRTGATIRRARAFKLASEYRLGETARTIALRVTQAYFDTARAARRVAILNTGLEEHRRLSESIGRRVAQEVSARSDLDLATSRTAQLEQELALATAQRDSALQTLRELVGDPAYDPGIAPRYDAALHHPDQAGVIEQALQCDPSRRRLQAEALVARADADLAEADIMPRLSAQYSNNEITGDRIALVLRAQTNGGLSQLSSAEAARLRRQASELQVPVAERELREAVALDMLENNAARARIGSGSAALYSARTVTESYQRQFTAGRRTWLDVMNAVREATSAELAESDAETSAMASAARILLRTCRWQPEPEATTQP
jgi:adhesin transport system outer membrane protein